MQHLSSLLLLFPLLGFLVTGLLTIKMRGSASGIIASSTVFINLILTLVLFGYVSATNQKVETELFDWIKFANISIPFALTVDRLSALMLLIVNGVGLLIHIYSIGYMKGDEGVNRFFFLYESVYLLYAHFGIEFQLPGPFYRMGGCRPLFLSAYRILV